jgi:hypothetical protein
MSCHAVTLSIHLATHGTAKAYESRLQQQSQYSASGLPNMHPLPTAHCYTAARTARLSCRPRYIYMQCVHHGKRDGWDDIPGAQVVTPGMWYPCRLSIPNPALSYSRVYLQACNKPLAPVIVSQQNGRTHPFRHCLQSLT